MPRKISVGAVAAIILLSCLCGCSKKDGNADKLGKLKEKMEQQTTANKSNESSSKKDIQKKQQQEQTEDEKAPEPCDSGIIRTKKSKKSKISAFQSHSPVL